MAKIPFSDVTPPEKRSIRNIPIPNGGKRKVPFSTVRPEAEQPKVPPVSFGAPTPVPPPAPTPSFGSSSNFNSKMAEVTEKKDEGPYEYYYPKSKKESSPSRVSGFGATGRKKWIFGTATAIVIAVFIVGMMTVFASATIDITPKSQDISVDMKLTGTVEMATSSVRYEVVKLSKSKSVSVAATGEEAAEIKASGKIIVYNNFSSDPQRLIVRTRFESPEGLIYRIAESIVVPGKSVKDGKDVPGSIEAQVFADEAGDKYNIKKVDFTIPGFKNDAARFKNIYARSSTDMTGGFIGKRKVVSAADKQNALQSIDSGAQADLQKDLQSKVPDGLALLPGSIIFKSVESPQKDEGSSVTFEKSVTAYAMMLNVQDLSDKITSQYISKLPEWNKIKPMISDLSLLNVSGLPDNLDTGDKINFQISGKARVFAYIDTNLVNQKLLGAPKEDAAELINQFAGISSVTAAIRPIWKQSFPTNPSKIYVHSTIGQ